MSRNPLNDYARYSAIAIQMCVIIALGTFAGIKIDGLVKWKIPIFTILLSLFSVAAAIYLLLKDVIKKK